MKYWLHPFTEKRPSRIEGDGLFAKLDIKAGEIVVVAGGQVMDGEEYAALRSAQPDLAPALSLAGDRLWLVTHTRKPQSNSSLNHSCDPNVVIDGQIMWRTWRKILADEEITVDYSTFVDLEFGGIDHCACGSRKCRQKITYQDWKLPVVQAQYGRHFSSHILQRLAR